MSTAIKLRGDTTSNWATNSTVVLADREVAVDTTLNQIKIGDGVSMWSELPYITPTLVNPSGGLNNYAPKASPTFTGTVTLPSTTPTPGTYQAATTNYVDELLPTIRTSSTGRGFKLSSKVSGGDGKNLIYIDAVGGTFSPVLSGAEAIGYQLTLKNISATTTNITQGAEVYWIDSSLENIEIPIGGSVTILCLGVLNWTILNAYGTIVVS